MGSPSSSLIREGRISVITANNLETPTMFNDMPEKLDTDDCNIFWGAVDFALSQLNFEFKDPVLKDPTVRTKFAKDISASGDNIPVSVPSQESVKVVEVVAGGGGV